MVIEKDVADSDHCAHRRWVSENVHPVKFEILYPEQVILTVLAEDQGGGGLSHGDLVPDEENVAWAHRVLGTDPGLSMTGYAHVYLHVG